jgi:hypothetical protein
MHRFAHSVGEEAVVVQNLRNFRSSREDKSKAKDQTNYKPH